MEKCTFCNQIKDCGYLSAELGWYCKGCSDIAIKIYRLSGIQCDASYADNIIKIRKAIDKFHCGFKINENCRNCDLRFFCYTR